MSESSKQVHLRGKEPGIVKEPDQGLNELFQQQYRDLKKAAQRAVRDRGRNPTMGATALVNELYVKWAGSLDSDRLSRATFFVTAAVAMQRILISYQRGQKAVKRGGKAGKVEFIEELNQTDADSGGLEPDETDALANALSKLKAASPRQYQVAMLRHYMGMTNTEIADVLESSGKTVQRDWQNAKKALAASLKLFEH